MTAPAVISAYYTHAEFKPGLKVCRLVFEIPQEKRKEFFDAFGYPDPANPIPVAIARLNTSAEPTAPLEESAEDTKDSERVPFHARKRASQCAIKCRDEAFGIWIAETYPEIFDKHYITGNNGNNLTPEAADLTVKEVLGIKSKTELDSDPAKADAWDKMLASFDYRGRA